MTIEIKTTTVIPSATRNGAGRKGSKYKLDQLAAGQHVEVVTDKVTTVRGAVAAFKRSHSADLAEKGINLVTRTFKNESGQSVVGVYAQKIEAE